MVAISSAKAKYFPYLCKCMSFKHHGNLTEYSPRTTPLFAEAELINVTPDDIVKYMSFSAYGTATPGPDDRPTNWRSDTAEFAKKAISHYMPNTGAWNQAGHGNPTRSRPVQQFIANLKRLQVRQLGKASAVKRDMKMAEFKLAAEILEAQGHWNSNRWLQAMRMQFHMIGRGDDVHHMETKSLHVHPKFDFALETSMMWSKNVLEERDCPPQIMLGAANPVFCIILSLAIYLEERFSRFGLNSRFLYTEAVDDEAPKKAVKSYSKTVREKVFLNALFCAQSSLTQGSLGMHSLRKFPATWASMLGAAQHEIDTRGRWKKGQGRVSTRYINPEQPYQDARVCGLLCVDGPIKYSLKNGCGVSSLFLHEHVCPKISEFFGQEEGNARIVEVLGTALLWACFDPQVEARVPAFIRERVKQEYGAVRPEAFEDVNPVEKIRLVIFQVGEAVIIDEDAPVVVDEAAPRQEDQQVNEDPTGGAMAARQPHIQQRTVLQAAGRRQLADHTTAQLHGMSMRLARVEEALASAAGELKMEIQRQVSTINKNVRRLQMTAPTVRRAVPGNGNNDAAGAPIAIQQRRLQVQLSKRPKDLYSLWTEYTHGLGGLKPARDFTSVERGAVKQKYYRRKIFWDVVATHIDGGFTAPTAIDLVYQVYGRNLSVTMVLNKMLEDRKRFNGRPHPRLRIRTAGQPRLQVPPPPPQPQQQEAGRGRGALAAAAPRIVAGPAGAYRNLPGRRRDHDAMARHQRERADRLAAAAVAEQQQQEDEEEEEVQYGEV